MGLVILAIFGFAIYGAIAAVKNMNRPKDPDYSASLFRGTQEIVPLPANPRKVSVTLKTSWIPGDHAPGTMRYVVDLSLSQPIDPGTDSIFLGRISSCSLSIDLLDKQGFKLTTIPVKGIELVDDQQNAIGIADNDSVPMSQQSYESIAETWSPTWNCF